MNKYSVSDDILLFTFTSTFGNQDEETTIDRYFKQFGWKAHKIFRVTLALLSLSAVIAKNLRVKAKIINHTIMKERVAIIMV